jgi:branched-chain amino acid transport system ATP-binding protein
MSNQNLVPQSEVIMNLKDINLSFGGLKALSGVNLQIKKGEILAIIGPNGAGKSSMLNIISGIYVPQKKKNCPS